MQTEEIQFLDRLLNCSDCHSEFIFTAGEQLFFHDKQFKNDPKRCKPCKSRRSGLSAVANGTGPAAAGLSRTETRTQCSECNVETTVPFKPTQGRPVLCRQCFQMKMRAVKPLDAPMPIAASTPFAMKEAENYASTVTALTDASLNADGAMLSSEAATVAATAMAGASSNSSVASAADLAAIAEIEAHGTPVHSSSQVPAAIVAASESVPADLLAAEVSEA